MTEETTPQAGGCIELPPPTTYWWSPKAGSNLPSAAACWSLNTGPHPDWDVTPYYSASEVRAILVAAVNQPAPEFTGWYCAHCQRGVDSSEVTFHEQHQACGRVITDDRPPAPGAAAAAPSPAKVRNAVEALIDLDARLRECFGLPISAEDAYDTMYQEMVAEALAGPGAAAAAPCQDAEDAARYRWLRDHGRYNGWRVESETPGWVRTHSATSLDAALDAARTTRQGAKA